MFFKVRGLFQAPGLADVNKTNCNLISHTEFLLRLTRIAYEFKNQDEAF